VAAEVNGIRKYVGYIGKFGKNRGESRPRKGSLLSCRCKLRSLKPWATYFSEMSEKIYYSTSF